MVRNWILYTQHVWWAEPPYVEMRLVCTKHKYEVGARLLVKVWEELKDLERVELERRLPSLCGCAGG